MGYNLEIEMENHTGGTATCTKKAVCTVCGNEYGNPDKTNHVGEIEVKNDKEATCGEAGYTGDTYCKDCGEQIKTGETIAKKAHSFGEPEFNWSEDGKTCTVTFTCKNDASHTDTQDATVTSEIKTAATCKNKGVTTYTASYSDGSDTYTDTKDVADIAVDAANHAGETEVKNDKEAGCTVDGYTGDTYCKDCGEQTVSGSTITALGHDYTSKVTKEPTTTEEGERTYTCTRCGDSYTEVIPATGDPVEPDCKHTNTEVRDAKEAGCTETGYTGDIYCKDCGEQTVSGSTIATLGHDYTSKVTKEPTTTEEGERTYTCTRCGDSYTETIPATGGSTAGDSTTGGSATEGNETDDDGADEEIPAKGTELVDTVTKSRYKVVSGEEDEPEVIYVGTTDKKATTIKIPETVEIDDIEYTVTAIADGAFKNNKKITKVEIADGVITIGKSAFYNCTSLKTVKIGDSVQSIGDKAFYGCKKLTSLTMGTNVTTIGNSAFQNCTALKKVTIPKNVTKIGKKAFYGCKKLTSITIKTTKLTTKKVGSKAFSKAGSSNYKKLTVKVPKSKLKSYKTMLRKRGLSSKAKVKK